MNRELAAREVGSLSHAAETETGTCFLGSESAPIVPDPGAEMRSFLSELDCDHLGIGMPDRVCKRLLHDPIHGHLPLRFEVVGRLRTAKDDLGLRIHPLVVLHESLARCIQVQFGERVRAQVHGHHAQVAQRLAHLTA